MGPGEEYRRFRIMEDAISPRVFLGSRGGVHWYTGDEHDEYGHITEHSSMRTSMVEKRMRKLELIEKEVPLEEKLNFFGDEDSDNIILSWGSPKGAILEALERLRRRGFKIGFIQVRMVHPLPASYISQILKDRDNIIDVETNYSAQLGGIIMEKTGIPMNFYALKYNGRSMTTTEVYEALERILRGEAPERQVLTHGA